MSERTALRDLRGFVFDADGTLYRGESVLPGAAEFIADLRRAGVPWLVATNNSTTSPTGVAERLARMGIPATADDVVNSSQVSAAFLAEQMPGARVLVVGETGLYEALAEAGVTMTEDWRGADAVVVGMDREATYAKLRDAALAIRRGARFIATNTDRTLPTEMGLIPGAGSLIGMLEIATDVKAHVIGKPSPDILCYALARLKTPAALTAAVGDRSETDILGGQAAGMPTIAVLTGAGTTETFAAMQTPPDWIFENFVALRQAYFGE